LFKEVEYLIGCTDSVRRIRKSAWINVTVSWLESKNAVAMVYFKSASTLAQRGTEETHAISQA
jgi:hypothetical protein